MVDETFILSKGNASQTEPKPAFGKRLPKGKFLPGYAAEYFNQLVAQFLTLTDSDLARCPRAGTLAGLLIDEQNKEHLNWGDLCGLEMCLLKLAPDASLPHLTCSLRARYRDLAGQDWYEANGPAAPAAAAIAPADDLRADLEMLLAEMQRLRALIATREEQRNRITLMGAGFAVTTLLAALGLAKFESTVPPASSIHQVMPVLFVILSGATGGLVSMLRRLQSLPRSLAPVRETIELDAGQPGLWLAPVYGAIFATVIYLVFLGGMLNSLVGAKEANPPLFPSFTGVTLASNADFAKLMVWAFIAGFAEKFVPDVLDRITARNQAAADKPSANLLPVNR